jgi:MOSC domain-containing protein YiiM
MNIGSVVGIYISHHRGQPTESVEQIHVIPGCGIEGDRYYQPPGLNSRPRRTGFQITLIEQEAIEAINMDGIQISPEQTRRNIITCGISLNNLVGVDFSVGGISLRGIRLCEPCDYLAGQVDPRLKQSMSHRGGLRADILTDGFIYINDSITTHQEEQL